MEQLSDTTLFTVAQDYPPEKKARLLRDPFRQRCYLEALVCLANSDIDVTRIKAKVLSGVGRC